MLNRERVGRHRAKQAARGFHRLELLLPREVLEAVDRYAADLEETRAATLRSLVITGLRTELQMPAPEWFSERVRDRFR